LLCKKGVVIKSRAEMLVCSSQVKDLKNTDSKIQSSNIGTVRWSKFVTIAVRLRKMMLIISYLRWCRCLKISSSNQYLLGF